MYRKKQAVVNDEKNQTRVPDAVRDEIRTIIRNGGWSYYRLFSERGRMKFWGFHIFGKQAKLAKLIKQLEARSDVVRAEYQSGSPYNRQQHFGSGSLQHFSIYFNY